MTAPSVEVASGRRRKIPGGRVLATIHAAPSLGPMPSPLSPPPPAFPNLTVLEHPLIRHKLTILRDKRTSTRDFKQLVNEIAMLMAYEVTKDLPLEPVDVETPLERGRGARGGAGDARRASRRVRLRRRAGAGAQRQRVHPARVGGRGGPAVRDEMTVYVTS